MDEATAPEPPVPARPHAHAARRGRWQLAATGSAAAVVGVIGAVGAALVVDRAVDDGDEPVAPAATARPVPVLAPEARGSALSEAVSQYAITAFSDPTRGLVLSGWGAAFADLFGEEGSGPTDVQGAVLLDDPRLLEPTADPAFDDPCIDEPGALGCPDPDDVVPASVLGRSRLGANSVVIHAFPGDDVELAAECAFSDVRAGEIPIAVTTANPGTVEVHIGDDVVTVDSSADEVSEFDAWRAADAGSRPASSFVAHCIAVPRPRSAGPLQLVAVAVDDAGQVATAETVLLAGVDVDASVPISVTPLDPTMVRIDVPLAAGSVDATVLAVPLAELAGAEPDCATVGEPAAPSGWRLGATALRARPEGESERPYLRSFPRIRRTTVAVPEGEATLLCVASTDAGSPTSVLLTPPDARRLRLAVTAIDLRAALPDRSVEVRGTFATVGWTPCGTVLPATPAGRSAPGLTGLLCASGGDSGAIASAGGVLDLSVRTGDAASHTVGIALSAAPRGPEAERYLVPIPAPDLRGVLCTAGVEQPGCIEPRGDAVLGTLEVTAFWDEGPIGPPVWTVAAVPTRPPGDAPVDD